MNNRPALCGQPVDALTLCTEEGIDISIHALSDDDDVLLEQLKVALKAHCETLPFLDLSLLFIGLLVSPKPAGHACMPCPRRAPEMPAVPAGPLRPLSLSLSLRHC